MTIKQSVWSWGQRWWMRMIDFMFWGTIILLMFIIIVTNLTKPRF